jgi:tetratricopeptide (TPR) repeat protein
LRKGALASGRQQLQDALAVLKRFPGDPSYGMVLQSLGDAERLAGRNAEAGELYRAAADAFRRAGDPGGRGTALAAVADIEYRLDRYAAARALYLDADAILSRQGDNLGRTYTALGLALVAMAQRDRREFETQLERARALAAQNGSPVLIGEVERIEREARAHLGMVQERG